MMAKPLRPFNDDKDSWISSYFCTIISGWYQRSSYFGNIQVSFSWRTCAKSWFTRPNEDCVEQSPARRTQLLKVFAKHIMPKHGTNSLPEKWHTSISLALIDSYRRDFWDRTLRKTHISCFQKMSPVSTCPLIHLPTIESSSKNLLLVPWSH